MNIVISGYTAAGKTTHARLLAAALDYKYISAAEILLEKLGFDTSVISESAIWFYHNDEISQRRREVNFDEELDSFLLSCASSADKIVFDSRFLPWLSDAPMIRVWLESSLLSRARKCSVSLGLTDSDVCNCARVIHDKDNLDVARLAQDHDSVFGPDRSVFDVILDNSSFISAPTDECSTRGIRKFHPYILAAVNSILGNKGSLRELCRIRNAEDVDAIRFVRRGRG